MDQGFPDEIIDWRRVMLQSQLDLAALFIATGRGSFDDARRKDYEFSRDRAVTILREVETEIRSLGDRLQGHLHEQLRELQTEVALLAELDADLR